MVQPSGNPDGHGSGQGQAIAYRGEVSDGRGVGSFLLLYVGCDGVATHETMSTGFFLFMDIGPNLMDNL